MYREITIHHYRGLSNLRLQRLDRFNLIAGGNNIGKTSVLEAVLFLSAPSNPAIVLDIEGIRGITSSVLAPDEPDWMHLHPDFDVERAIEVGADDDGIDRHLVAMTKPSQTVYRPVALAESGLETEDEIESEFGTFDLRFQYRVNQRSAQFELETSDRGSYRYSMDDLFEDQRPHLFLSARHRGGRNEDVQRFSRLREQGQDGLAIRALRLIEPRLVDIEVLQKNRRPGLYGDLGGQRLQPLAVMGEGMTRLASIVLAIASAAGGVVLLDEIENGLYHQILPDVWAVIREAAVQYDVQIFATTHSLEAIHAAYAAFQDDYHLSLYRLERNDEGAIEVVQYGQESLSAAIEFGFEVR